MKDEDTIRSALTWFGDQGGQFDPLDAFNKVTESYAKLLAACKLFIATPPDDRRSIELELDVEEAIKLAEGNSP